jgi:hypothetical protein
MPNTGGATRGIVWPVSWQRSVVEKGVRQGRAASQRCDIWHQPLDSAFKLFMTRAFRERPKVRSY